MKKLELLRTVRHHNPPPSHPSTHKNEPARIIPDKPSSRRRPSTAPPILALPTSRIVEDFGFDLSSVTRAFYRQIVREQRIPLNLSYPEPNEDSLQSIREADAIIAAGGRGYKNADEMFAAMGLQ